MKNVFVNIQRLLFTATLPPVERPLHVHVYSKQNYNMVLHEKKKKNHV